MVMETAKLRRKKLDSVMTKRFLHSYELVYEHIHIEEYLKSVVETLFYDDTYSDVKYGVM